ncbi:hypothetical protein [Bartonella sp. B39]
MTYDFSTEEPEYLNFETFKEGINELEHNKIVAKGIKKDCYFINPDIFWLTRRDEYFECDEDDDESGCGIYDRTLEEKIILAVIFLT